MNVSVSVCVYMYVLIRTRIRFRRRIVAGSLKRPIKGLLAASCNVQVLDRGLTITNVYGTDLSTDKSFYAIVTAAEHAFKIPMYG